MSAISDLIAQLESGGGANASSQPASMVDPVYGQYSGFANQYGSGAAGVDNYAGQYLAANPNATIGDFYSNYVLGTGSTSNPQNTYAGLQSSYPSAATNLASNIDPSTPLASLVSGGSSALSFSSDANDLGLQPETASESNPFFEPGTDTQLVTGDEAIPGSGSSDMVGTIFGGQAASQPTAGNASPSFFTNLFADTANWLQRGAVIIIGIVLIAAAAFALSHQSVQNTIKKGFV